MSTENLRALVYGKPLGIHQRGDAAAEFETLTKAVKNLKPPPPVKIPVARLAKLSESIFPGPGELCVFRTFSGYIFTGYICNGVDVKTYGHTNVFKLSEIESFAYIHNEAGQFFMINNHIKEN